MSKTKEEIEALDAAVAALIKAHGVRRLTLHRTDGVAEEVWAVCSDDVSAHAYASTTSKYEPVKMRILNSPEGFAGMEWGDEVNARTHGAFRPYALEHENMPTKPAPSIYDGEYYAGW